MNIAYSFFIIDGTMMVGIGGDSLVFSTYYWYLQIFGFQNKAESSIFLQLCWNMLNNGIGICISGEGAWCPLQENEVIFLKIF